MDQDDILRNLKPNTDLELVDIFFYKITVDQHEGLAIALFEAPDKIIGFELNSIEGTMFTFAVSGCVEYSHIRSIYQLYVDTMKLVNFKLDKVIIESKKGDVIYGRLFWTDDKNRKIYKLCSAGDALVLATLEKCQIKIIKNVLDIMDDYTALDNQMMQDYED